MRTSLAHAGVGAVALVAAMLVGVPTAWSNTPVQLNSGLAGDVDRFEISLDAERVVFSVDLGLETYTQVPFVEGLYSAPIDGSGPPTKINQHVLPGDFNATFQISPDSTRVVYLGDPTPGTLESIGDEGVYSVPIEGGASTKLFGPHFSWKISPDGERVVYDSGTALFSVPIGGGAPVRLASGRVFQITPDSSRVVYGNSDTGFLEVVPIAGGPPLRLSSGPAAGTTFAVTPDALRVVYPATDGNGASLFSVPITGGPPVKLNQPFGPGRGVDNFQVSPDSKWVAFRFNPHPVPTFELHGVPVTGGSSRRLSPSPDLRGVNLGDYTISPDSQKVLVEFLGWLHRATFTGGPGGRLTAATDDFTFTTDSGTVIYGGNGPIAAQPFAGGAETLLSGTESSAGFELSPGRTRVIFEGGSLGVFRTELDGSPPTMIDRGFAFQVSSTGAHVVYKKSGSVDLYSWADPDGADAPGGPPPPPPGPDPGPGPGPGPAGTQVGLVDASQGRWHLRDTAGQLTSFFFGNPGDVPVMGDWDCDGTDTPGLFRTSDAFAYLSNANRSQIADIRFFFGDPSDVPLAGDFDGDGCDTLSIYRPSEGRFYIINELGENEGGLGAADFSFGFGDLGDKPVVGDWDGDGIDEIGLHRESTGLFYWRDTLTTGIADGSIIFGDPGDRFVAGDWGRVDGRDTPGLFRPSAQRFFFRHTLTQGNADSEAAFGEAPWLPVAGEFGL